MVGSRPFFSALLDNDTTFLERPPSLWAQVWHYLSFWGSAENRKLSFQANFEGMAPKGIPHPFLKTRKVTFNHVFSFYLDEHNQIWYARRENPKQSPNWKPLYVDGLPKDKHHNMEIIADGANLMIAVTTGENTTIHYKKVIEEKRIKQPDGKFSYLIKNLCEEAHSITEWFSLPFIKYLKYKQLGKRLTLRPGATWAMSHVGAFKHHSIHPSGIAHSIWGTTTLYEIVDDVIRLHDPFVSVDSALEIALPHSDRSIFKLNSVDASGSVIILLGEEMIGQTDGSYLSNPALYTKLLDYDVMGCNPLQQCAHDPSTLKRFIRIPKWQKHELPPGQINTNVSIVQTGIDYHAVELRIGGSNNQETGFFHKSIDEDDWSFQKCRASPSLPKSASQPNLRSSSGLQFHHKTGFILNNHSFTALYCQSFHEKATYVPLILIDSQGTKVKMHLHRRRNLIKAFFGFESDYWHLVLDKSSLNCQDLFKGASSIPVKISIQKDNQLIISSTFQSLYLKACKKSVFEPVEKVEVKELYAQEMIFSDSNPPTLLRAADGQTMTESSVLQTADRLQQKKNL